MRVIADGEGKLSGSGRLVIRASGTEPVIRIMGEGDKRGAGRIGVDDIVDVLAGQPERRTNRTRHV